MQMKSTLVITALLFALAAGQVFSNWNGDHYSILRILFLVVGIASFAVFFMLVMDLTRKDFTKVRGAVLSRNRNQVWVKLDSGKLKSCVIAAEQKPESFAEGRPVELTLGRRSRLVRGIELLNEQA
ncbi:hypothetical protein [Saccharibacillus alkalitolerans]|uniref:NfeD-like C-terminal domain-containing protein n=1 Tax=Saccharibacillus alkalitolerans TaxID=2705290 RepID=A0ABX0F279_9BACL|nr:hypothetical protein [Saccharibacillus alkalitolerans]NGZ74570.1 hypothetical protein [Saccharibacillus alkalitolerans]